MQHNSQLTTEKKDKKMIQGKANREKQLRDQIFHTLFLLRISISNCHLYTIENQRTRKMIAQAYTDLKKILRTIQTLTLLIIDDDIIINNKAVRAEEAAHFALFTTVLQQKDISHIVFKQGVTLKELHKFITDLASPGKTEVYNGPGISSGILGLKEDKQQDAAAPISMDPLEGAASNSDQTLAVEAKLKSLSEKQLRMAQELYVSVRKKQGFEIHGVQETMSSFITFFSKSLNPLSILTPLKDGDEYTFTHSINVCILTLAQAESLGFTDQHLHEIGIAATLYDIGKTFIPEELLNKKETLSKEEQKAIMGHAVKGAAYLLTIDDAPKLAVLAALEHHIRYGGGGYPNIGKTWTTNIVSQMIAIADTYDAMRCSRSYREPSAEPRICEMLLKDNGARYNPYLVKNFLKILKRNKTGAQTS